MHGQQGIKSPRTEVRTVSDLRWLLRQMVPCRDAYTMQLSAGFVVSLVALLDPLVLKWLIDRVLPWRQWNMLAWVAVAFFGLFVFRFGFAAISRILDAYTAERLKFDIRRRLLVHLQSLSPRDLNRFNRGDLLHRFEHDVDQISRLGGQTMAAVLRIVVTTSLSISIMLLLNWQLALFVVGLTPVMMLLRRRAAPGLREASEKVQGAIAERYSFLESHFGALPQIQLLGRQVGERRGFVRLARRGLEAAIERRTAEVLLAFSYQAAISLASAAVLGFGGYQVLRGRLTLGGLVAFYSYLMRFFDPFEVAVQVYSEVKRAGVSIGRARAVFDTETSIVEPLRPRHLTQGGALEVDIDSLEFSYDKEKVLAGFDLRVEQGERVAFVGTSGGGKSTVVRLLARQYDPHEGEIRLGGVPLPSIPLTELRRRVAIVAQEPILFDVSLRENLLYACPGASEQTLKHAVRLAQLDSVVDEIGGWDAPLGRRGDHLSGGQRQRVAIARALLQPAGLLVLDEATSGLDGVTESNLLEALDGIRDRTILMVAHRLSAMRWADRLVVIDGGRVLDTGSHEALHTRCRAYRDLVDQQNRRETPAMRLSNMVEDSHLTIHSEPAKAGG